VRISKGPKKATISGVRTKGIVSKKFNTKGAYTIVCDIHAGMILKLKVS
jgi:plastocyanin